MTTTFFSRLLPSDLGLSALHLCLSMARRCHLIQNFALDTQGLWYGHLIEAFAPRYDHLATTATTAASCHLPCFAFWTDKGTGEWFIKLWDVVAIID